MLNIMPLVAHKYLKMIDSDLIIISNKTEIRVLSATFWKENSVLKDHLISL